MIKLYLDTNVFLSYWQQEMRGFVPLFERVRRIFEETIECKYYLVISGLTIAEMALKIKVPEELVVEEYLKEFSLVQKIDIVSNTKQEWSEARKLAREIGLHLKDSLHVIAAKNQGCILVTEDKTHREKASKKIEIRNLEEL